MRPLLLTSGLRSSARRSPDKLAVKAGNDSCTYGALIERIDNIKDVAYRLWSLRAGDTAAILAPNCIEYYEYISALSEMGVAVATINYRLSAPEVARILKDCGAKMTVFHDSCEPLLPADSVKHKMSDPIPSFEGVATSIATEEQPYAIPYTSGTTGHPKGVMVSHRARVMTFYAMASEYQCFSSGSHFLAIAPLCHGAGFAFGYAPLFCGGTVEILAQFDAEIVLSTLAEGQVDGVFMVPAHFQTIFNLDDQLLESVRGKHRLKAIISNASALPQPVKHKIVGLFGEGLLHETYGSTEGGIVTNLRPEDQLRKFNCVGPTFVDTEVSLRDDQGNEVPANTPGELFSRGPATFSGYWDNQTATDEVMKDGWVSVGDIATRDDEGHIYIIDRKKDMIISGGINVYPREIENVLIENSTVDECAVFGIADPRWGETIHCAAVVSGDVSAEHLTSWLEQHLARFKIPKEFHFVAELPRNASGKILKRVLVEQFSVT